MTTIQKKIKLVKGDLVKANGAAGVFQGHISKTACKVLLKSLEQGFNIQEFHPRQVEFVKSAKDLK